MLLPNQNAATHKAWLYRLLSKIYDKSALASVLLFKGGTCAAMLGWLDRFSVDLDFDYSGTSKELPAVRHALEQIFKELGLAIKDASKKTPQYFLRYPAEKNSRNTIKIDVAFPVPKANIYRPYHFSDIDRVITCQTPETMFANKLIALIDRYEKREVIAGRDLYDIHHFFLREFRYNEEVIKERRNVRNIAPFFAKLIEFVDVHITQGTIDQGLNVLLAPVQFRRIRTHLKAETLMFLRDELARLNSK